MRTAREKARRLKEAATKAASFISQGESEPGNEVKKKAEGVSGVCDDEEEESRWKRRRVEREGEEKGDQTSTELPAPWHDDLIEGVSENTAGPSVGNHQAANGDLPPPRPPKTHAALQWVEPPNSLSSLVLTKPSAEMRGHTSYLTFACYYPASVRQQLADQDPQKPGVTRVAKLAGEAEGEKREGSMETEFGSEGMDQVMGTLTEEEMIALAAGAK